MIIHYKKLNIFNIGGIAIKPGVNEYKDIDQKKVDEWITTYPKVKVYVDDGTLEFPHLEGKQVVDDTGRNSLVGLKDKDALALVRETGDRALLETWLHSIQSSNVRKAIQEQITAIDKAGEPADKK